VWKNEAKARTGNKSSGSMGVMVLCSGTGTYMKHAGKIKQAAQLFLECIGDVRMQEKTVMKQSEEYE